MSPEDNSARALGCAIVTTIGMSFWLSVIALIVAIID